MSPLERLLAEELPTGTFGDARPAKTQPVSRQKAPAPRGPDPLAAQHCAELLAALSGSRKVRRHLHAVPAAAEEAA
ncbi:hypothetical protein [Streptomyces sp. NPDC097640]|uniref:hypothetical protein n=1 Tax=Streptomyces sp. NPDC097640 TaxID=3157229 RepID=UPI00332B5CB4